MCDPWQISKCTVTWVDNIILTIIVVSVASNLKLSHGICRDQSLRARTLRFCNKFCPYRLTISFCFSGLWHHKLNQLIVLQGLWFTYESPKAWVEQQVILLCAEVISNFILLLWVLMCNIQCYLFRGMSTVHAVFITVMSVYLVFFSNLFSDQLDGPVTFRTSNISNFALGVKDVIFQSHSRIVYITIYSFLLLLHADWILICSGFCWVLHHWHCYDILGISFSWWNGVCKCIYLIANIFFSRISVLYLHSLCA